MVRRSRWELTSPSRCWPHRGTPVIISATIYLREGYWWPLRPAAAQDRTGYIVAEFLIDYDMYLRSLKRLATLPVEILCQGHHLVFVGEDTVRDYFARSIREAERLKDHVSDLLQAHEGDVEKVMARIKSEQYDSNPYLKQPEEAYLLNLRARITHLAEKFKEGRLKVSSTCHAACSPCPLTHDPIFYVVIEARPAGKQDTLFQKQAGPD